MGRALRALLDPFLLSIIATMVLAIVLPLTEAQRAVASTAADLAVALLFLAYGMRLPTREVLDGLRNWRLQVSIVVATYAVFPLLGLAVHPLATPLVGSALAAGLLYTALLPSTVQSSVAFTSIARGNVSGALCAATISNIGGMFVTPPWCWWSWTAPRPAGAASATSSCSSWCPSCWARRCSRCSAPGCARTAA